MAFDYTKPIPITTVDTADYPRPKLNADGQWVVSASAVNQQPNKVMLYDPLTLVVMPVTPYTVSMDYYNQVKEYEKTLSTIQIEKDLQVRGMSDTTNPNQVNSIADVFTAGSEDFGIIKSTGNFFGDVIPKLFTGKFAEAGESWWKHSDVNWMLDKVQAVSDLVNNTIIEPVATEVDAQNADTTDTLSVWDSVKTVGLKSLNNSLINLGETLDLVTQANSVKGFVQGLADGGIDQANANIAKGNGDVYGKGRYQFDWNLKPTGNGVLDTTANILLEVVSDPTNWVTFGVPAIMKSVGKKSLGEVILKSADDVGIVITRTEADDLAKAALRTYIYKDGSLTNALRSSKIHDVLAAPITPEVSVNFFNAITNNVSLMKEAKTLSVLKTVRGASDAVQSAAMKAVGYSSAIGLGYHSVKALSKSAKLGINGLSYVVAKTNQIFRTAGMDTMNLKTMNESMAKVENSLTTMKDLANLADNYPQEVVRRAAKSFQETKYAELQQIINKETRSTDMYRELNEWAVKEGYINIEDLKTNLATRHDVVPEEMVNMVQELENEINRIIREAIVDTIKEIDNQIDPKIFYKDIYVNNDMLAILKRALPMLNDIEDVSNMVAPGLLKRITEVVNGAYDVNKVIAFRNLYTKMNKYGTLDESLFFDYRMVRQDTSHIIQDYERLIQDMHDPRYIRKAQKWADKAMNAAEKEADATQFVDSGMSLVKAEHFLFVLNTIESNSVLSETFGLEAVQLLKKTLEMWEESIDELTPEIMHNANILWTQLNTKLHTMYHVYQKVDIGSAAKQIVGQRKAFDTLHKQLQAVMGYIKSSAPKFESIRTITAGMVSRAVDNVPEALAKALRQNGVEAQTLSELILNLTGANLNDVVDQATTDAALSTFFDVVDLLEDLPDMPYFVKELGLDDLIDQWGEHGFSIELGNEVLGHMDDIIVRLATVDTARYEVQAFRDEVQELIDYAYQSVETRIKTTTELVSTKLYKVKLSHIQSLVQLLTTEGVEETFEEIRRNFGVGGFLDALIDIDTPNFATQAVSNLQGLSKSVYIARRLLNRISKSKFESRWKDGIYDTLAGMARFNNRTEIVNAESFAAEILSRAKKFIDNKDNAHLPRMHDLSKTKDVLEEAESLYTHAFVDFEVDQATTTRWEPLYKGLHKEDADGNTLFNITYSAAQTSKIGGQIYQFAHALPDGSSQLFINRDVYLGMLHNIDDTTALELFGTDAARAKDMLQTNWNKYQDMPNVIVYDNTEDFATAIYDLFQAIKKVARESDLTPRLIGYNNALDALGTDKALSDFTYKNMLNTRIIYDSSSYKGPLAIETIDAAQYMRAAYDGATVITDDMHYMMTDIINDVKTYLDQANAGEPFSKAYLMPDFTHDVTASIRELVAAIDNTLRINAMRNAGERYSGSDFVNLTEAQYNTLTFSFTDGQLEAYRQTLTSIVHNLGDTLLSIRESNQIMGQTLLIQDALTKHLHEPNIMQILNKYLVDDAGVPALSFKIFNDPKVFNTWFANTPEDVTTLGRMYDVAEHLQDQMGRIKHPMLIMDIPFTEITDVMDKLKNMFLAMPGRKYSVWSASMLQLKPSATNQLHNYLVAKQYWDSIRKISKPEQLRSLMEELKTAFPDSPLLSYIYTAQETVMSNQALYVPHIKVLQSELINASNDILQKVREIDTIIGNVHKMETLEDALTLDQYLREAHNYSLPSVHTKEQLTRSYGGFVDKVKELLNTALSDYTDTVNMLDTVDSRFAARQEYTRRVQAVLDELEEIKTNHAYNRAKTILSLSPADYAKFLYKYAQGVQIIDLGAKLFTDSTLGMEKAIADFMNNVLGKADEYGIRTVMGADKQYLYTFLDKDLVDLAQLEEDTKEFVLHNTALLEHDGGAIQRRYAKLANLLDEQTQGVYSLSMHRTMNADRYDELFEFLPKDVSDNLIMKGYLNEKDLLDTYSQTLLGDYNSGVGTVFSMYSSNLVTNVAAGFNSVYNHLRGKDMYKALLFNHEYKLKTWIALVSQFGKVPHKDVVKAINNKSMVVCKWVEGKGVVKVPIDTVWQYDAALKSDAMLLDYHSYTRAVEILNNERVNSKLLGAINRNFLVPLKVGQLMSVGWMLRNIPDSTIKGWVQAGFDPLYMVSMLTRTKQIIADYQHTYRQVFDYTKATFTPEKVKEFFAVTEPDAHLLDEALFRRLLTFYNSTSSVATPAQLSLYNDTAHKLFLKVQDNPQIKESDITNVIKIFAENPKFDDAKNALFAIYDEDVAKELLLLKKFVPKSDEFKAPWIEHITNGFRPVKKLMDMNNDFEVMIRTHTFLYHSTYTNGTVSDALKMVDISQFNRARDTKAEKILEMLMPFSSFQMDNFFFWTDHALKGNNNIIALVDDVLQGSYNEEELDLEELSRNMSLQYLFLSGNLILNSHDGLTLKTNDSVHNTLQLLTNPIGTFADMFAVPIDVAVEVLQAINANGDYEEYMQYAEEHGGKTQYGKTQPMEAYSAKNKWDLFSQLIPIVGVVYQRYNSAIAKGRLEFSDLILPLVMPSVFGVTKLDSAGTTYESRPIGTDWYTRDAEYKKTHRYVFGISYIPSWMSKDPQTYANTYDRLQAMGFTKEQAAYMMQNGWYMKAPDYVLKHYTPYVKGQSRYIKRYYGKRSYAKRYYARRPKISRSYPKYAVLPKKQKKFKMKSSKYQSFNPNRTRVVKRYGARRIYRMQLYSNRYTRTGVSREAMINWRGPNRSSRQLLRDRSRASRMRQKMLMRQIKPS